MSQSRDRARGLRVANRLGTGTVGRAFYLSLEAPFGGWGISGVGVEHGIEGFRDYLRVKTIAYPHE